MHLKYEDLNTCTDFHYVITITQKCFVMCQVSDPPISKNNDSSLRSMYRKRFDVSSRCMWSGVLHLVYCVLFCEMH